MVCLQCQGSFNSVCAWYSYCLKSLVPGIVIFNETPLLRSNSFPQYCNNFIYCSGHSFVINNEAVFHCKNFEIPFGHYLQDTLTGPLHDQETNVNNNQKNTYTTDQQPNRIKTLSTSSLFHSLVLEKTKATAPLASQYLLEERRHCVWIMP